MTSARTTAARSTRASCEGNLVECPRHGAKFDVTTGRAVVLPAVRPVKTYPVEVDGDDVKVDVG